MLGPHGKLLVVSCQGFEIQRLTIGQSGARPYSVREQHDRSIRKSRFQLVEDLLRVGPSQPTVDNREVILDAGQDDM
jgi:hypothetical protein